jgi:hypothetical protein
VAAEATPLSDRISRCVAKYSEQRYQEFLAAFLESEVGVAVETLSGRSLGTIPDGAKIQAGAGEFGYGMTLGADGRRLVLACADFHVFRKRFGGPYNATVSGRELLRAVPSDASVAGIQVNSAASQHNVVIGRDRALALLGQPGGPAARARPWWKLWG